MIRILLCCVLFGLARTPHALAGSPQETWSFDETTSGEDVNWSSPTSVDASAARYPLVLQLALVEITVEFLGLPLGPFDVTDQVPPEQQTTTGCVAGPAPVTLSQQDILFPPPPEPPAVAATLSVELNADGFGFLSATNVVLGTLTVDLGFPFGIQDVNLTSIRLAGNLTITAETCPADVSGDGLVDAVDLANLLGGWGECAGCAADLDCDGLINAVDLAQMLGVWGACSETPG